MADCAAGAGEHNVLYGKCLRRKREAQPMAKKVTVTLVDDFDGEGAADETVEFGLDGVTYEIDLSAKNATKLRNDLKQWVEASRRVGGRRRGRSTSGGRRGATVCAH